MELNFCLDNLIVVDIFELIFKKSFDSFGYFLVFVCVLIGVGMFLGYLGFCGLVVCIFCR